ncbi:hypothetical protein [Flavobacterium sp. ENC]|uniref:hypothetical protein n=1 Tax=Flavobacterium sp. ENC TaxID=2897330 RepID=UPI001E40ED6A|nr:hypothetical protein [Flavobacterium sp. ENC]MCD0466288.1 hypothetical protein [Flavobacterium sp. ENC]
MNENNLIASVALFSELYNNDKFTSVTDILAEFIKGVVVQENKWTITSTELTYLLEKIYDFKIPESVVRTTVRNRLKDTVSSRDGHYVFDTIIKDDFEQLNTEFISIQTKQKVIIEQLLNYIEEVEKNKISESEKYFVIENFNKYLLDNGVTDKYSKYISAFIIKNQSNFEFTSNLNLIREGIILYQGIKYTADINELGKWNSELTIFLSTEHLFNSLGFNGLLYKQIFDDFYNLVREINSSSKNKNGDKLINLYYLEETKNEVNYFFQTAESILKGSIPLDTSKTAMKSILNECSNPSDIVSKRIKFENDLKSMGIYLKEFKSSIYDYPEYVVEDESILNELKNESEKKGKFFDENLCRQFFKIFTKVNYFRGGESKINFEKIGHIFITGNRFALYLAHQSKVKFEADDIPFAKDIDYITNKFWFKLKKGFSDKSSLPKSFDVVTKAQIILSSQLNQSVYQEYKRIQEQLKNGTLSKESAIEISYELREKPNKPEEISIDNLDNSLEFLNSDTYFEDLFREKEKKEQVFQETLKQNEELQKVIQRLDIEKKRLEALEIEKYKNIEEGDYIASSWRAYKKNRNLNLIYTIFVFIVTILPIVIGFILKANKTLNTWMESLGDSQLYIWLFLVLVFVTELFGRSYIFNKEKVKNGWIWLTKMNNKKHTTEIINKFKREFENRYVE